ncbi:hypothetical protein OF83DRAFT_1177319 [Amylostereum chailletii]|nr:hypothetical protein OF83DRAFT_1177319 [Amylostereum chailletii]
MARFPYMVNPETQERELEMPPSMVALIFTAVYASLYEWRSGEHIKDNRPALYHKMMHELWVATFGSAPQAQPPSTLSMAAVIDLDALE